MRRYIAAVLLAIFLTQSSGVAVAGTPSSPSELRISELLAAVHSTIIGSRIYAVLTGSGNVYSAMHAPAPVLPKSHDNVRAAAVMARERPLHPLLREGTLEKIVMPDRSVLDPQHRRLDPLAMRHSTPPHLRPNYPPISQGAPVTSISQIPVGAQRVLGRLQPGSGTPPSGPTALGNIVGNKGGAGVQPQTSSTHGTGIEHWWTYQERAIPGVGKAMVNVGTGNLLVSATDVDIHEQGIDLAFQRVYNSQSLHDYNGDDGGDPAIYGNLWTNNFDANIVYDPNANTITVYDLDGTACTYTASVTAPGGWQPCAGEYATLIPTDSSDCTYAWTKPNGTVYWFHTDAVGAGCGLPAAKRGRIQQILARNQNNNITFAYSYDSSGSKTSEHITQIVVTHSDGDALTMQFGIIAGTTINELSTITLPDTAATLNYLYDASGNLLEVDKPGNNAAFPRPSRPDSSKPPIGDEPETYAYSAGSSKLQEACGPRCTVAMWNSASDGGALLFTLNTSAQLTSWQFQGVLNFTPDDGTTTVLHSGKSTSFVPWYTAYFVYGSGTACSGTGVGTTTMCDTDGHANIWTVDNTNRITQTQGWAGTAESQWIVTKQQWDSSNNLTSTTDANQNITQYGYDNNTSLGYDCCGNMVEMQLPQSNDITGGLAPLSFYSYDSNFNVTAYCDPVYNANHGKTWVNSPGGQDTLCSGGANTTALAYTTSLPEPFGCLTSITKPGSYKADITYGGSCGNGLPVKVQADQSIANYDSTTRQPTQDFAYDGSGNLTGYDKGQAGSGAYQDSWTLGYNRDNRLVEKTNNDTQITGAAITSMSCYYPDGSLFYTETPSQWSKDGNPPCPTMATMLTGAQSPPQHADSYYYDLDGDQIKLSTHKGCSTLNGCPGASATNACKSGTTEPIGTTCKYYDGLDRLVETIEPYDTRTFGPNSPYEFYAFRWMNRYIYDLSQSGGSASLTISDGTGTVPGIVAYGNLFKTQEYLPQTTNMQAALSHGQYQGGNAAWSDIRGSSFDGLNRGVGKYELAYGTSPVTTNSYDCTGQLELLCSTLNAVGQTTTYTYDHIGRVNQVGFSGTAPAADGRTYTFDPDGRTATISNSLGTLTYAYDVDGNTTSVTEPSNQDAASLICYAYYADGLRSYLGIGVPGSDTCGGNTNGITAGSTPSNHGIRQPQLFRYAYRNDGLLKNQQVNWLNLQINGAVPTFLWTYGDSGRELTETDPLNNAQVTVPPSNTNVTMGQKAYQYDSYGRVSQLTLPEHYTLGSYTYDDDDELVQSNASQQIVLNARGEMIQDGSQLTTAQGPTQMANGTQVGNFTQTLGGNPYQAPPATLQYDVRSGMVTCGTNPYWVSGVNQSYNWIFNYDLAGRQTNAGYDQNGSCTGSGSSTTNYDAENHIHKTYNMVAGFGTGRTPPIAYGTVDWGPDGRQRSDHLTDGNNNTTSYSAHWDGDAMLFSRYQVASQTAVLYIGKFAAMSQAGDFEVIDRDESGAQQTEHGVSVGGSPFGNWYDSWSVGTVRSIQTYNSKAQRPINVLLNTGSCGFYMTYNPYTYYPCPTWGPDFSMKRGDGYTMIGGIVQGARTYDPTSGQWLTPDAYAGDVHDPMSQKPFIWNNNNPIEYGDPSGYTPWEDFADSMEEAASKVGDPLADAAKGLGNEAARDAKNSVEIGKAIALDVVQGIYRFISRDGNPYTGKSTVMPNRLTTHVRSGFLPVGNLNTLQVKSVPGNKQTLSNTEQDGIDASRKLYGTISNKRNAVAPSKRTPPK